MPNHITIFIIHCSLFIKTETIYQSIFALQTIFPIILTSTDFKPSETFKKISLATCNNDNTV